MTARLRKLIDQIAGAFWLVPAGLVVLGIFGAFALIWVDRRVVVPEWLLDDWLYNGGATGARTLLGAVASSTIGVAGTIFSITIAALSLAAGQMGPRLLHNFTRDRGNQVTLGVYLGTFCYALVILRSVRTPDEGTFIPHLSISLAIALAFVCVAMLVYFVGHMSERINVDTVIELVSADVHEMLLTLTSEDRQSQAPPLGFWQDAVPIADSRQGYLLHLDENALAAWASERQVAIRLLVGPGDHVFPGAPVAVVKPSCEGVDEAIRNATALGPQQVTSADLRFAVRQLVEVAVRALSPGINDPHTAMTVLNRLGTALCQMAPLRLQTGVWIMDEKIALVVPHVRYQDLVEEMFQLIRHSAAGNPAVLSHMIKVMTHVVSCERDPTRLDSVRMHADLVLETAERHVLSSSDLDGVRNCHRDFVDMVAHGPLGQFQRR
jgi:uncharacterized membrane protein